MIMHASGLHRLSVAVRFLAQRPEHIGCSASPHEHTVHLRILESQHADLVGAGDVCGRGRSVHVRAILEILPKQGEAGTN